MATQEIRENTQTPRVCTLIVSYNFERWINPCLQSLRESSVPTTVVVVDNASTDRTCQLIEEHYPEVILIKSNENLGFGRGNNIGFDYALREGFDYVFLLNEDAWIAPNAMAEMLCVAQSASDIGIVSPIHLTGDGSKLDAGFAQYTGLSYDNIMQGRVPTSLDVAFVNAALWLIPIRVVREMEGFSPIFRHYGEDVNYVQRVRHFGYRCVVATKAIGYHDREQRPVTDAQRYYADEVYHLTQAVNPLLSDRRAMMYGIVAPLKKAVKALLAGKREESLVYVEMTRTLAKRYSEIHAERRRWDKT